MAASAANATASPARCMRGCAMARIQDIFQSGLHEFLTEFIDRSVVLGGEISQPLPRVSAMRLVDPPSHRLPLLAPIPYAIQTLRLTPRPYDGLAVIAWQVRGERMRELPTFVDGLGNIVHCHTRSNRPHDRASIAVEGEVETRRGDGIVRGAREPLPPLLLSPRRRRSPRPTTPIARLASDSARGASGMDRLSISWEPCDDRVAYRQGVTDARTTRGRGARARARACARTTRISSSQRARALGIPARYVGGYLWTGNSGGEAQASHAWAEAYLDDLGWVGFDPANRAAGRELYPHRHRARLLAGGAGARHPARRRRGNARRRGRHHRGRQHTISAGEMHK